MVDDPNAIPFLYKGEARLIRWAESSGAGRTVTLQLSEDSPDHAFKGLKYGNENGVRMQVVAVLIDDHEQPQKPEHAKAPRGAKNAPVAQLEEQGSSSAKVAGSSPAGGAKFKASQLAALKCKEPAFQEWIRVQHGYASGDDELTPEEVARLAILHICEVGSRSELDTNSIAAATWDGLMAAYEYRHTVR